MKYNTTMMPAMPLREVTKVMLTSVLDTIQSSPLFSGKEHTTSNGGIVFVDKIDQENLTIFFDLLYKKFNDNINIEIDYSFHEDEELTIDDFDMSEFTFVKLFVEEAFNAENNYPMVAFETI